MRKKILETASWILSVAAALVVASHGAQAASFATLYNFGTDTSKGYTPLGRPLVDSSGNLWGTASNSGTHGQGVIYEYIPGSGSGSGYNVIYNFGDGSGDGQMPMGNLIMDTSGALYGTTNGGGAHLGGTVYKLKHNLTTGNWDMTVLHDFCSTKSGSICTDGNKPRAGLTYVGAATGALWNKLTPLFGMTGTGGLQDVGAVFKLQPASSNFTFSVLHSMGDPSYTCGSPPVGCDLVNHALYGGYSGVTADASGNLYGAGDGGGADSNGGIFKMTSSGGSYAVIHSFCDEVPLTCYNGSVPRQPVTVDSSGNVFGVAFAGGNGAPGAGVVYELSGGADPISVLYRFCPGGGSCSDGYGPSWGAGVILQSNGDLYGTTVSGGANGAGVMFKLSGSTLTVLHSFCSGTCTDGQEPIGGMSQDSAGNYYGVTQGGTGYGAIWEYTP